MARLFVIIVTIILVSSCTLDEELISTAGGLSLIVSTDTVLFDTLLTDRGSITRRFRIKNPNKEAIKFDRIALGGGDNSSYFLTINGRNSETLVNQELRDEVLFGNDSLQVLVSAFIDPQDENLPYLVKDSVVFDWNGNSGHVKLVAYGQDAIFINADTLCDMTWTNERPYVIYNYALVDTLCLLNIQQGAQIFLDNGAALLVKGSLQTQGTAEERITIKNTRFDFNYERAPGQWDAIYFLEGSNRNQINYTDILNGNIGLRIGTPDPDQEHELIVKNSTIGHMSSAGVLAFNSDVFCENTVIYNCGLYTVGNFGGGTYQYDHCTLVNYPNYFFREEPSVQFSDNLVLANNSSISADLDITIRNSIIWGTEEEELLIVDVGPGIVTAKFKNGILKTATKKNGFISSRETNFPGFLNPHLFDYRLDSVANSINQGADIGVSIDLNNVTREGFPDIGAYEYIKE